MIPGIERDRIGGRERVGAASAVAAATVGVGGRDCDGEPRW